MACGTVPKNRGIPKDQRGAHTEPWLAGVHIYQETYVISSFMTSGCVLVWNPAASQGSTGTRDVKTGHRGTASSHTRGRSTGESHRELLPTPRCLPEDLGTHMYTDEPTNTCSKRKAETSPMCQLTKTGRATIQATGDYDNRLVHSTALRLTQRAGAEEATL